MDIIYSCGHTRMYGKLLFKIDAHNEFTMITRFNWSTVYHFPRFGIGLPSKILHYIVNIRYHWPINKTPKHTQHTLPRRENPCFTKIYSRFTNENVEMCPNVSIIATDDATLLFVIIFHSKRLIHIFIYFFLQIKWSDTCFYLERTYTQQISVFILPIFLWISFEIYFLWLTNKRCRYQLYICMSPVLWTVKRWGYNHRR